MTETARPQRIPKRWRNHGYSFGLEFPYLYGRLPATDKWAVWHRHSGIVIAVVDETNPVLNEYRAHDRAYELNGSPPADVAALDSTP